ncbi:serine O-acetyltransferase [Salinicola tamaricis]|uniref:serine O-acetyltransferase n=1 Tax=Salinicola tamaricis TaxID=1771309 RepID=UPI000D0A6D8A|nr:hypothetical protein [Salinicola tamaricis]
MSEAWTELSSDTLWPTLVESARSAARRHRDADTALPPLPARVDDLAGALVEIVSEDLATAEVPFAECHATVAACLAAHPEIAAAAARDLLVLLREDAAIPEPFTRCCSSPATVRCSVIASPTPGGGRVSPISPASPSTAPHTASLPISIRRRSSALGCSSTTGRGS